MARSATHDSQPLTGWRGEGRSIDGEGIRYGFATSAWKIELCDHRHGDGHAQ